MEITELYDIFKEYPQVTTDTRNCPSDSIFFALKGANFDGNKYAKKAIESGCKYAIVDDPEYEDKNLNILLVDNVLKSLQTLAAYHRRQFRIPVIGITGTNGKTTSKELITMVLSKQFHVLSTIGNLNNHIGVPLTLLRMTSEHEVAIIEMGANHVGEIQALAEISDPDFGLITNVGHAHLEGFGSFENVIRAKGELYKYIEKKGGKLFVDNDNDYLKKMHSQDVTCIFYGVKDGLFASGRVVSNDPFLTFEWKFSKNYHQVRTNLIGEYNLTNVLAAVAIGKYFGVKTSMITQAISEYVPTNNRSQLTKTDKNTLIVDAYNANPTSMRAAIQNFIKMNVANKVLILGDMLELGKESQQEHQKVVDLALEGDFEKVFLVGNFFSNTSSSFVAFRSLDELMKFLNEHVIYNKTVLIKGSRGARLEKLIDIL